jgi:hypothetical protein
LKTGIEPVVAAHAAPSREGCRHKKPVPRNRTTRAASAAGGARLQRAIGAPVRRTPIDGHRGLARIRPQVIHELRHPQVLPGVQMTPDLRERLFARSPHTNGRALISFTSPLGRTIRSAAGFTSGSAAPRTAPTRESARACPVVFGLRMQRLEEAWYLVGGRELDQVLTALPVSW